MIKNRIKHYKDVWETFHNLSIVIRTELIVIVFFIVTVITIFIGVYRDFRSIILGDMKREAQVRTHNFRNILLEYEALPWLITYWEEHCAEMDIPVYALIDTEGKWYHAHKRIIDLDETMITEEEAERMSPEDQRLFAEVSYVAIASEMNRLPVNYMIDSISCIGPLSEDSCMAYFERRGNEPRYYKYPLGEMWAFDKSKHPIGTKVFETGEEIDELEETRFTTDLKRYELYYTPVVIDKEVRLMIVERISVYMILLTIIKNSLKIEALVILILLIGLYGLFTFLNKSFTTPVTQIKNTLQSYRKTKNSTEVVQRLGKLTQTEDEIGSLAKDICDLSSEMDHYTKEIRKTTAENERYRTELSVAAAIQQNKLPNIFPPYPERHDFTLYASMKPAREVGGDFYDYFLVDDDHIALVIADVSDKGLPASLFMMESKILIRSRLRSGDSPSQALMYTNDLMLEGNKDWFFVTVWLAVIKLSTGEGIAVNAGHEHPALLRAGGKYELVVYRHSPAVALMEKMIFKEHDFKLNHGDTIFVYTDGAPEAKNADGQMFGTDRLLEALNEKPESTVEETLERVSAAVSSFVDGAEQFDDITMLCFKLM